MIIPTAKQNRRSGFTLIELLVVILIITLLISLTAAGVFKALNRVADVQNVREISDLQTGIVNFQQKYKVEYIPSRIRLLDSGAYDTTLNASGQPNTPLDYDSAAYLSRVWHNLTFPIDWNNNGVTTDDVTLEGDQCLVFFLGGIQNTTGTFDCLGFSTNSKNPMTLTGDHIPPFFDFKSERLTTKFHTANTYFSYLDAYGKQPFAYFSSYKRANGYNRYFVPSTSTTPPPNPFSDCNTLGVWPYSDGIKYQNAETFQIISAGRDGFFGQGSNLTLATLPTWTPASADQSTALPNVAGTAPKAGFDDMANFFDRMLGVPSN
jgi:general secretion pathway protein G